jgi:uncharacterized protein
VPVEITFADGIARFAVRVQPRAKRDEITGEHGGALKIRLAAPPIEGRANDALCRFLADCLNVPLAAVKIAAGAHSRAKRVEIRGVTPEQIRALAAPKTVKQ